MNEAAEGREMVVDAASAAANKTITGEIATAEKIAAYQLDIPPLSPGRKILTVIELIGMGYIMYLTGSFIVHHIQHLMHVLAH